MLSTAAEPAAPPSGQPCLPVRHRRRRAPMAKTADPPRGDGQGDDCQAGIPSRQWRRSQDQDPAGSGSSARSPGGKGFSPRATRSSRRRTPRVRSSAAAISRSSASKSKLTGASPRSLALYHGKRAYQAAQTLPINQALTVQQFSMRLSRVCIVRRRWRCAELTRGHERGFSRAGEV